MPNSGFEAIRSCQILALFVNGKDVLVFPSRDWSYKQISEDNLMWNLESFSQQNFKLWGKWNYLLWFIEFSFIAYNCNVSQLTHTNVKSNDLPITIVVKHDN